MTKDEQNLWRKMFHVFQVSRENTWRPKIYASLQSQIKQIIPSLQQGGITAAKQSLHSLHSGNMDKLIRNIYIDAGRVFGAKSYQLVKKQSIEQKQLLPIGYNEALINDIINYFELNLLNEAVLPITETTKAFILRTLTKAEQEGVNQDDIVRELITSDLTKTRAALIARTEVSKAASYGSMAAVKKTGFKMNKTWISAVDNRTRRQPRDQADHLHMNGITIPMDEDFQVPDTKGGADLMQRPCDSGAPAAQVINCFLPNELTYVNEKVVKKAFRNIYNGEVVTVQLSNGNKFTCTINHPILTDKGFVGAGLLTKESKLINSSVLNDASCKLHVKNTPTTFEQLYDSLNKLGSTVRVGSSLVNFYGDKPASDVDVVQSYRTLSDRVKRYTFKSIVNRVLVLAYLKCAIPCFGFMSFCEKVIEVFFWHSSNCFMRLCSVAASFFRTCISHPYKHRFASIPLCDTVPLQDSNDNGSGSIIAFGNRFHALTGMMQSNNPITREGRIPPASNFNTIANKNSFNGGWPHMEHICNLFNTTQIFVKTVDIVEIKIHTYIGFVYTLETDNQMYDINSVVARNCRCTLGFEVVRGPNGLPLPA